MSRRLKLGLVRQQGKGGAGYWNVEKRFANLQKAVLKLFNARPAGQDPESVWVSLLLVNI